MCEIYRLRSQSKILKYLFCIKLFCHAPPFLLLLFFSEEERGEIGGYKNANYVRRASVVLDERGGAGLSSHSPFSFPQKKFYFLTDFALFLGGQMDTSAAPYVLYFRKLQSLANYLFRRIVLMTKLWQGTENYVLQVREIVRGQQKQWREKRGRFASRKS